jgi:O-antigen/teichoic acid export membrane protein
MVLSRLMIKHLQFRFRQASQSAVVFGWFSTAIRMGANLLLVPLIVTVLTEKEQALWWVFLALANFANLADFGFGQSITRVYSYLWAGAEDFDTEGLRPMSATAPPNAAKLRVLNTTVTYLYWRLSLVALALLAIGGTAVLWKPIMASGAPATNWVVWTGFLLANGYALATSHWVLACQGISLVRQVQASYLWGGLLYFVAAATLLECKLGLAAMVIATTIKGLVIRWLARRAYLRAVPHSGTEPGRVDFSMLKRLWPNAKKFGILSLGAALIAYSGVMVSSQFLDAKTTASFGLTAEIGRFMGTFAMLWLTVKWPDITILRTQGRLVEMSSLFARRLAMTLGTFAAGAVLLIWIGNPLLQWKGSQSQLLATPYLVAYLFYLLANLFYVQFGSLAYTENVIPFFRIAIFTGVAVVASMILLTWQFGLWGMIAAPFLAEWAYSGWFTVRRGFQGQPLTARQMLRAALGGRLEAQHQTKNSK